jgi:hypothetical protein
MNEPRRGGLTNKRRRYSPLGEAPDCPSPAREYYALGPEIATLPSIRRCPARNGPSRHGHPYSVSPAHRHGRSGQNA